MGERVRRKLLHVFKMGEIEVLFNTDYLSTGIDIPCTGASRVLTASPNSKRATFQRWGRALRVVSSRPDKTGIIAFVTSDPRESTPMTELLAVSSWDWTQRRRRTLAVVIQSFATCITSLNARRIPPIA